MMRHWVLRLFLAQRFLPVILAAFVALGVTYSITTPIFEAGDEIWHYPFVQYLASGHGLPIQDPDVQTLWEQEGGQPPLYYALSALATFWIDTRDLPDRLWRNPHAKIGIPLVSGNKNMIVHTSAENFPWQNTALAVHLIRFLSILLSAVTVGLTYFLALEIHPEDRVLAAMAAALVAFNPMFVFISASVNNDNIAVLLATLALLLLARLVTRGANMRRCVSLGVVMGFAALSKVSNLGVLAVAAVTFFVSWRGSSFAIPQDTNSRSNYSRVTAPETRPTRVLAGGLVCLAIVAAIAGWWYVRNWMLYGDPLGFNVWVQIAGGRPQPATLAGLLEEFQGFRISFWGNFGGLNIIAPDWVYGALDALTILALLGLVVGWARGALPRLLALPALWLAIISMGLVRWTLLTLASQGRLIFPAIGAVAILLAFGLRQLTLYDLRFTILRFRIPQLEFANLAFVFFLLALAALAPFALIAPAYALPVRLPAAASVPNPTHITFGDQAELVGYTLPERSGQPGGNLPLTLYWGARAPMAEDFSVYIRLIDADGKIVGRWEAFPGGGLYPTRVWQSGEIIVDPYRIPLASDARGPAVGRIEVGLFRRVPLENLTARDPQGNVVTPTVARFKIAGQSSRRVENPMDAANFGDQIALIGSAQPETVSAGSALALKLHWRALAPMSTDYTIFVHLLDETGKTVAQKDDQPQGGRYPTSFWDAGEIVPDEYAVAIPRDLASGDYRIEIGIYRAGDGARLPLRSGGDVVGLGSVRVTH